MRGGQWLKATIAPKLAMFDIGGSSPSSRTKVR